MLKKSLSLLAAVACIGIAAASGMFAAKEQGPPGAALSTLESAYISTTDTGLPAAPAIIGAALGLGFTLLPRMLGDRLRRSSSLAGRVNALLKNSLQSVLSIARLLSQSHVQTSRSSLTT